MKIHPTAIVSAKAELSDGVEVGPYSIVGDNLKIGANTRIDSHVVLAGWTTIGSGCQIFPGAVIGTIGQDVKFKETKNYVEVGDNTIVREYVTINRPTGPEGYTRVGKNVFLLAYSHVAHECEVGDSVVMANAATIAGHVTVEEGAVIGGLTGIHQFCKIGKFAMIGGASRVIKDVLPYTVAAGNPAKIGGLNTVGLNRRGFSQDEIATLKKAYRLIFRSKLNVSQAVERIQAELKPSPHLEHLLNFINNCERGIAK